MIAAVIATVSVVLFFVDGRQPEMAPQEYLRRNLNEHTSLPWLLPLLYILAGADGRAVGGNALFQHQPARPCAVRVQRRHRPAGVGQRFLSPARRRINVDSSASGSAITVLACAMLVVATGSLLPSIEDWFGARREMRTIEPLSAWS